MSWASEQRVVDTAKVLDRGWEGVQKKTFTNWINNKLKIGNYGPVEDLHTDLCSGVKLIQLLEVIGDESLGRYNKAPKLRLQKIENMSIALDFIRRRGVFLTNIGPEDIVDGNRKLVLGLVWMIILRFSISDISEEGLTAKEGLLLWCQRKCAPYSQDFTINDFTVSWQSGLAFCALIHRHRPDLIDYWALDKNARRQNVALAFEIAQKDIGIARLLDVEDVVDVTRPDERSIMTYVAQYFHAFSAYDKLEQSQRRVERFGREMQQTWDMEFEYERRVQELMANMSDMQQVWANAIEFDGYRDAKRALTEFETYKNTTKRSWVSEKRDLDTLLGNIQTKLRTYNMQPYFPPEGLTLNDVDLAWNNLLEAESARKRMISRFIFESKEVLRKMFAEGANAFTAELNSVSQSLAQVSGDLESQLETVRQLATTLEPMNAKIQQLEEVARTCEEAGIDDNEYTVYSIDDLLFDFGLLSQSLQKKAAFIENQMVLRGQDGLTPQQMEEYSNVFRHFDKDGDNRMSAIEFKAALQSQSIVLSDTEFDRLFAELCQGRSELTFEEFINFVRSIEEDRVTPDQLIIAFRNLARDKDYITENDMVAGGVPAQVVEYFTKSLPPVDDGYDYINFIKAVFV